VVFRAFTDRTFVLLRRVDALLRITRFRLAPEVQSTPETVTVHRKRPTSDRSPSSVLLIGSGSFIVLIFVIGLCDTSLVLDAGICFEDYGQCKMDSRSR
jgi:hypothetical protein